MTSTTASYYLLYIMGEAFDDLTNKKLNKLLYFAQGHYLKKYGRPPLQRCPAVRPVHCQQTSEYGMCCRLPMGPGLPRGAFTHQDTVDSRRIKAHQIEIFGTAQE